MTDIDRRLLLGLAGVAGATLAAKLAQGGSLNPPPGPIVPTGKTTDQIEPRIDLINAPASANVTSDADTHYIINNPGSYYLAANLPVSKQDGIRVNTDGVVLDLCGFQISRGSGSGGTAIGSAPDIAVVVRNGTVRGFGGGVYLGTTVGGRIEDLSSISCGYAFSLGVGGQALRCTARYTSEFAFYAVRSCSLVDCATSNTAGGFSVGHGCSLSRCLVSDSSATAFQAIDGCSLVDCTAKYGFGDVFAAFSVSNGCVLTGCTATSNTVQVAFSAFAGCVLKNCTASANTSASSVSAGFRLDGSVAHGCVADQQFSNVAATNTTGIGFLAASTGNLLEGCVAHSNLGAGFYVDSRSVIANNQAIDNGSAGIDVIGTDNVIETNRLVSNSGNGVLVEATLNLVFGNCARGNTAGNYSIVAGNRVAAVVTPAVAGVVSGNIGGTAFTTDPYANVAY